MYKKFFKWLFDLFASLIGLIIISPIAFLIFFILVIVNKGKPFFYQKRPNLNEALKDKLESSSSEILTSKF